MPMTVAAHYQEKYRVVARKFLCRVFARGLETKTPWLRSYLRLKLRTLWRREKKNKNRMRFGLKRELRRSNMYTNCMPNRLSFTFKLALYPIFGRNVLPSIVLRSTHRWMFSIFPWESSVLLYRARPFLS